MNKTYFILFSLFYFYCSPIGSLKPKMSKKVRRWNDGLKIFKCPIITQYEKEIDPSILIHRNTNSGFQIKNDSVVLSNQTEYLVHHVKSIKVIDNFTFAYASMASLFDIFDNVQMQNQRADISKKNISTKEKIPDDKLMRILESKKNLNGVFELSTGPIYKCLGTNSSSYALVKSTNESNNLQINDIIFGKNSHGYLETIKNIDRINVSVDEHRFVIETKLTYCNRILDTLENRISNLNLIDLNKTDLNCKGGYNSDSSLYLVENSEDLLTLNLTRSVIVGRESNKFAFKILTLKEIGQFILIELIEIDESYFSSQRSWAINDKMESFSISPYLSIPLNPFGSIDLSFSFSPTINATLNITTEWFTSTVNTVGLTVEVLTNFNAKSLLSLQNITFTWPEKTIINKDMPISISIGGIPIPGTFTFSMLSSTILKTVTSGPIDVKMEFNLETKMYFPFIYNKVGSNRLPDSNSVKMSPSYSVSSNFDGLKSNPIFGLALTLTPQLILKWPNINTISSNLKNQPWYLDAVIDFIQNRIEDIQLSAGVSLPIITNVDLSLCSAECSKEKAAQISVKSAIGNLSFNFKAPLIQKDWSLETAASLYKPFKLCLNFMSDQW